MQSPRGSINIGSYYRTVADTTYQQQLISGHYKQQFINNGPKTTSDDILESLLLMTFSILCSSGMRAYE
jgi:hypothetical protein